MQLMEVCVLELMGKEEEEVVAFVSIQVWCIAAVDVPTPDCHALSTQQQGLCMLGISCVYPSGLPFRNTLKSSCLSSSLACSFCFHHSLHLASLL